MNNKKDDVMKEDLGIKILKMAKFKFIPDIIEIKIIRKENNAELIYRELFTYIPDDIIDNSIQIGKLIAEKVLLENQYESKIKLIEKGIEIKLVGPAKNVVVAPLSEILIFGNTNPDEMKEAMEGLTKVFDLTFSSGILLYQLTKEQEKEIYKTINEIILYLKDKGLNSISNLNLKEFL